MRYIDKDRNILREIVVDFPMKMRYTNHKYCNGNPSIGAPNMYYAVIVGGRIFVQGYEFIYEIIGE